MGFSQSLGALGLEFGVLRFTGAGAKGLEFGDWGLGFQG